MLALVVPALGMISCGGGGGGGGGDNNPPPDQFSLATKADVAREIANAFALLRDFDPRTTSDSSDSNGPATLAPGENAPFNSAKSASGKHAKAIADCQSGGTQDTTDVDKTRTFTYFPAITINVTGGKNVFSACKIPVGQTFSGVVEDAFGDTDNADEYRYTLAGSGNNYYSIDFVQGSGQNQVEEVFQLLGLLELGVFNEERQLIARNVSYLHSLTSGGKTVDLTVTLGKGASSVNTTDQFSALLTDVGELSLDGVVEYHSTACEGGTVKLQTQEPLIGEQGDPVVDPIIGGKLKITAGASSATITFNDAGGASVDFGGGHVETLTADDIATARETLLCRNPS